MGSPITFLFVGPAVNILAIAYTRAAIGFDIALARIILSIAFGIGIGLLMAWFSRAEERVRAQEMADSGLFDQTAQVTPAVWGVFALLFAVLIVGTLQIDLLTRTWGSVQLPVSVGDGLTSALSALKLNLQGAVLILMLLLIAPVAYLGLEYVLTGFNRWTPALQSD